MKYLLILSFSLLSLSSVCMAKSSIVSAKEVVEYISQSLPQIDLSESTPDQIEETTLLLCEGLLVKKNYPRQVAARFCNNRHNKREIMASLKIETLEFKNALVAGQ